MSAQEAALSPFLKRSVECPVCRKVHEHRMFRVRIYVPKEMESDQHVTVFKWMNDRARRVHPPYYSLYYCPYCFFTDFLDDFRDHKRVRAGHMLVKTFKSFSPEQDRVVEFLGRHVNYDHIDFHSALNLHYLAIFIQGLLPEELHDSFKVGRLSLRLAWLFRERDSGMEIPDGPQECMGNPFFDYSNYEAFLADLKALWPQAPLDESEAMSFAAEYWEQAISNDARFDSPREYYQGVKLLLEILRRCGNLEGAYNVVRGIYLNGMDARQEFQKLLTDKSLSEKRKHQIELDLKIVNNYMSDAGELRDEFLNAMVDRDLPKVQEITRNNPGLKPKELEDLLAKNGVLPEVLRRLKERLAAARAQQQQRR